MTKMISAISKEYNWYQYENIDQAFAQNPLIVMRCDFGSSFGEGNRIVNLEFATGTKEFKSYLEINNWKMKKRGEVLNTANSLIKKKQRLYCEFVDPTGAIKNFSFVNESETAEFWEVIVLTWKSLKKYAEYSSFQAMTDVLEQNRLYQKLNELEKENLELRQQLQYLKSNCSKS